MTTYKVHTAFGEAFTFAADLAEASAPLCLVHDDDSDEGSHYQHTQYQTADARHDPMRAAVLMLEVLGPDFYHDPSAPDVTDLASLIVSVK